MFFYGISGVAFEGEIEYEAADKSSRKVTALYIVTPSVLNMDFSDGCGFASYQNMEDFIDSRHKFKQ